MTRIKFLSVALVAVFALTALAATSALAEEKTKMLPESGVNFKGIQLGEGQLFSGGNEIKCKTGKGSGTIDSANLGQFSTEFEGCKFVTFNAPCATNAALQPEVITAKGTYHFWLALETISSKDTLVGALVELPTETHFTCVVLGLNQLIIVKGCVAALARPLNTLSTFTEDVFARDSNGNQLITRVLPEGATSERICSQLSSVNGGTFEPSELVGTARNGNFENAAKEKITVLLMNPEGRE